MDDKIAFTSHFFGQSPLMVEKWPVSEISRWYEKAVKTHNQLWTSKEDN